MKDNTRNNILSASIIIDKIFKNLICVCSLIFFILGIGKVSVGCEAFYLITFILFFVYHRLYFKPIHSIPFGIYFIIITQFEILCAINCIFIEQNEIANGIMYFLYGIIFFAWGLQYLITKKIDKE